VAIDTWDVVRRALYPLLVITQTVPLFVVAPLLVRWFGFDLTPKVVLVAAITFFPMTVAWADGFAATKPETVDLLRSFGAGPWQVFRRGRLPTAVPWFLAGLRIAVTYAVVGAIVAEYVGARQGLGIYIRVQLNQFRTDLALAAVVVATIVTLLLVGAVDLLRTPRRAGPRRGTRSPLTPRPSQRPCSNRPRRCRSNGVSLRVRIAVVVTVLVLGAAALSSFAFSTVAEVRVNGPLYRDITQAKDLTADILPPPIFVVETFLTAHRLSDEPDPAARSIAGDRDGPAPA
jgi:ABC-type proline/glycine betaine transport system permease subunit